MSFSDLGGKGTPQICANPDLRYPCTSKVTSCEPKLRRRTMYHRCHSNLDRHQFKADQEAVDLFTTVMTRVAYITDHIRWLTIT